MKKTLILLSFVLTSTITVAQTNEKEENKLKAVSEVEYLKTKIEISEKQANELVAIYIQIQETNRDRKVSSEVRKAKIEKLEEKADQIVGFEIKEAVYKK